MVNIFVPNNIKIPISSYVEENLIKITHIEPEIYGVIEKKYCACGTKNGIALSANSIFIIDKKLYVTGFTTYKIDWDTEEEFITAVFWLVKSHFYKFISTIDKYYSKRTERMETTLQKKMSPFFHVVKYLECGCIQYQLNDTPVYCLKHIVLCGKNKGPTIESVI